MDEDDPFPNFFRDFNSRMLFGGLDNTFKDIISLQPDIPNGSDEHQSERKSLRDQLIIRPPPLSDEDSDRSEQQYRADGGPIHEHGNSSRDAFPFFNKEKNSFLHDFPLFREGGLNSLVEEFFADSVHPQNLEEEENVSHHKMDTDLDGDVRDEGLNAVLERNDSSKPDSSMKRFQDVQPFAWDPSKPYQQHSRFRGFHQSKSIIQRSDGSSEERIVKRGSDGNEEVTTIITSPDGNREVTTEYKGSSGTTEPYTSYDERNSNRTTAPIVGLFSALRDIFLR